MKIIIVAATQSEFQPSLDSFKGKNHKAKISFVETGVGMMATAVVLTALIHKKKPDLIIQVGIAGSFTKKMYIGKVVAIEDEMTGDLGVNENGIWKDIFDLKLADKNRFPFEGGRLLNHNLEKNNLLKLRIAKGFTVNQITTDLRHIAAIKKKYAPQTESMEGSALHYVCKLYHTKFIQIRAISNYVGERDKSKWDIAGAIQNLNNCLGEYLTVLKEKNV